MPTLHAGQSLGSPGFSEESRAHLQGRLRVLTGSMAIITLSLGVLFIFSLSSSGRGLANALRVFTTTFPNAMVFLLIVLSGGLYGVLRWRHWGLGTLSVLDGVFLQALVVPTLVLYQKLHFFAFPGFPVVVPFLILFVLARAVLVPSTARRTLLFAAPAALGVLAIQLKAGASLARPDDPFSQAHFNDMLVQNQVLLWSAAAIAAVASRVNLGLRRTSYDARHLGQYRIGKRIGEGAMGEVYLAEHSMMKRPTAIKLLRPDLASEAALLRFEQEVRQTSRLSHPNTISIYDYGRTADGVFYYAMEYLQGASLRDVVEKTGPIPAARVARILECLCGALHEAHTHGLVHRDIKPANIMLCERGGEPDTVKLLDFGLVRAVDAGPERSLSGTPETMAPEVVEGRGGTIAADIYSLCAVGYTVLTGRPVFAATNVTEMLRLHREVAPTAPSEIVAAVPVELESILMRGLDKNPGARPGSVAELRAQLESTGLASGWSANDARQWWNTHGAELLTIDDASAPTLVDATVIQPQS